MRFIVIGQIGSDAGYWVFENGHWVHHGGWAPEQLLEVSAALNIMRESTKLKTPGLAEAATKVVAEFAEKQLGAQLKGGGAVIIA
jgi:hypothetical protein